MLKAGEIFFLFSGKFSVFAMLSERRKIRKKIRKFGPITMHIVWEGVVNPDDLLSPQEWLAQLFDQPPESTLQSCPILKRSCPTDPDPKQLIITKRVRFRNGSSSMHEHEYSSPEPKQSVIVDLSQKRGGIDQWLSGESV